MKTLKRNFLAYQVESFFSPIRNKVEYLRLIINSARILILENQTFGVVPGYELKLTIDQMSRLFLFSDKKYFSISFPFIVTLNSNKISEMSTYSGRLVDLKLLSKASSILEDKQFNSSLFSYWMNSDDIDQSGYELIEELLLLEPSYIRYDHDPLHHNGKRHPLDHLDINYSNYGTYKLGLKQSISPDYFENILDTNTDCSFLID